MARFNLERESRRFAGELNDLLNGTVCNGANLSHVFEKHTATVWIGHGISKHKPLADQAFPLALRGAARVFMGLSYVLRPDDAGMYLMVQSSYVSVCLSGDMDRQLCHFDYERDKPNGWPEAHLQIDARSPDWNAALNARPLAKLHFPVGGRRYRPTLEDIIEFLILEGLVDGRLGWQKRIEDSRHDFRMRQLRAAVRAHPEVAHEALRELKK